jgi:hypothetical protein
MPSLKVGLHATIRRGCRITATARNEAPASVDIGPARYHRMLIRFAVRAVSGSPERGGNAYRRHEAGRTMRLWQRPQCARGTESWQLVSAWPVVALFV